MKRIILALAIVLAMAGWGWGETLYVRPVTGAPYGDGTGSSYANAYGGLAAVTWGAGAGKVSSGDTLYICGTFYGETISIGASGADAANTIKIRCDYAPDPGIIKGAYQVSGWAQAQADPLVWSVEYVSATSYPSLYINGVGGQAPVANLAACLYTGHWFFSANTIYLTYPYDPSTISGDGVCFGLNRYTINTNAKNFIDFYNIDISQANTGIFVNGSADLNFYHISIYQSSDPIRFGATSTRIYFYYPHIYDNNNVTNAAIYNPAAANTVTDVSVIYGKLHGNSGCGIENDNNQTGWLVYNNLFYGNRVHGNYSSTNTAGTFTNNLFFFNTPYESIGVSDAHTYNCYYRGTDLDIISSAGTTYDYTDILASYEATATITNPFPHYLSVMNRALYAAAIAADGTIYGGYDDGANLRICKSNNGGTTWADCGTLTFVRGAIRTIRLLDIDSSGNIYCSSNSSAAGEIGLWRSADGGANWTRVIDGTTWPSGSVIWGFDEDSAGRLFCNSYLNDASFVYRSTDAGAAKGTNWSAVFDASAIDTHIHRLAVDKSTNYIYCNLGDTTTKHYSSQDNGDTWNLTMPMCVKTVGIFGGPGYVLFGSDQAGNRIVKTTDNGATFDLKWNSSTPGYFYAIGGDSATGRLLAAATTSQTGANKASMLLYSSNAGETWTSIMGTRVDTADNGFNYVTRKAINGKVIVCFTGEDETIKNSYLIDLNQLASWIGKLPGESPCINAGIAIVGLTTDYAGVPIIGNPDIGAYEFLSSVGLAPSLGLSSGNRPPFLRRP